MIFGERRRYRAIPEDGLIKNSNNNNQRQSMARFRQWSNNSNSSTMTVDDEYLQKSEFQVQDELEHSEPSVLEKRVTFSESMQVDKGRRVLYDDEMPNLWYTEDEMDDMWEEFMDATERLRSKGRKKSSYVKSIQKTFASLSDAFTTADDILNLMNDASAISIRADRLGMERHVIDPDERQRIKSQVRQRVLYWQDADLKAGEDRAEKMRSASRNAGRAFVVLAYLVAERSAMLESKKTEK